jgi:FkbM family methyltransferase
MFSLSSLLPKNKISFSQCGEDLLIDFVFKNLLRIEKPTFLDIGANDPIVFNNTFRFYRNGCRGINIDPNKESINSFNRKRKNDINIHCGIGRKKETKKFYIFENSMLNTFDGEVAHIQGGVVATEEVQVETIANVLRHHQFSAIPDFLSLDTEGMDKEILDAIFSVSDEFGLPKVICVETIKKLGAGEWQKDLVLVEHLKSFGYIHHSDTFINSIFVHPRFLKVKIH